MSFPKGWEGGCRSPWGLPPSGKIKIDWSPGFRPSTSGREDQRKSNSKSLQHGYYGSNPRHEPVLIPEPHPGTVRNCRALHRKGRAAGAKEVHYLSSRPWATSVAPATVIPRPAEGTPGGAWSPTSLGGPSTHQTSRLRRRVSPRFGACLFTRRSMRKPLASLRRWPPCPGAWPKLLPGHRSQGSRRTRSRIRRTPPPWARPASNPPHRTEWVGGPPGMDSSGVGAPKAFEEKGGRPVRPHHQGADGHLPPSPRGEVGR